MIFGAPLNNFVKKTIIQVTVISISDTYAGKSCGARLRFIDGIKT